MNTRNTEIRHNALREGITFEAAAQRWDAQEAAFQEMQHLMGQIDAMKAYAA